MGREFIPKYFYLKKIKIIPLKVKFKFIFVEKMGLFYLNFNYLI